MEYYSAIKKNERMPFVATQMGLETGAEWNKSDREGEISHGILYMWNQKRNGTNELIYKTEKTHRLREWT